MLMIQLFILCLISSHAKDLNSIVLKSKIPQSQLGLWLQGPDKSYQLNSDKTFVPASLSKIVTAGAALDELGLEHRFETKIYRNGMIKDGVLQGDLYLQGGGDPSLVSESFWSMVNELKRSGLRKIEGQLFVDDFLYDQMRYSEGRQDHRVDRAYDAPIGALSFNWNSVNVFVRTGESGVLLFADPENEYLTVENKAKFGSKTVLTIQRTSPSGRDHVSVSGTLAKDDSEQVVFKSVTQPEFWAGYNFKTFLNQQGIQYSGAVQKKKVPNSAVLLVNFKSKPFRDIVADMNKFSNNYVAEMLTMALAQDRPATLKNGLTRIHQWVQKMGWSANQYVFVNPAGFSNENQIRPKDLGLLLVHMQKKFSTSAEFMSSLPISGVDGTLKRRLQDMKLQVRAKTGLLNGKIGLAGYVEKNNRLYTFAFMFNGSEAHEAQARELFDELLRGL